MLILWPCAVLLPHLAFREKIRGSSEPRFIEWYSNTKHIFMETATVSAIEDFQIKDFTDGNPIQVRVVNASGETDAYKKGKKIKVTFHDQEYTAKIVSDPVMIPEQGAGNTEVSIVIEKV